MYLAFAEILAKRVQTRYPGIAVEVLSTEGSVDNLARLRSGDVDMGLALADVAERDRDRPRRDRTPGGGPGVRELSAGDRARLRCRATTFRPSGKRVSIGAARSGAAATSEVLFEAAGLRGRVDMLTYRLRDALLGSPTAASTHWCGRAACRHRR